MIKVLKIRVFFSAHLQHLKCTGGLIFSSETVIFDPIKNKDPQHVIPFISS